jgi:hypothetical protein
MQPERQHSTITIILHEASAAADPAAAAADPSAEDAAHGVPVVEPRGDAAAGRATSSSVEAAGVSAASFSAKAAGVSAPAGPDDSSRGKLQALLDVCMKAAVPDIVDEALDLQVLQCFAQLAHEQQNMLWNVAAIGRGISQRRFQEVWVSLHGVHAAEWFADMRNKLFGSASEDNSCKILQEPLAAAIQGVLRISSAAGCDALVGQLHEKYCGTQEWLQRNGPGWQVAGSLPVSACIRFSW